MHFFSLAGALLPTDPLRPRITQKGTLVNWARGTGTTVAPAPPEPEFPGDATDKRSGRGLLCLKGLSLSRFSRDRGVWTGSVGSRAAPSPRPTVPDRRRTDVSVAHVPVFTHGRPRCAPRSVLVRADRWCGVCLRVGPPCRPVRLRMSECTNEGLCVCKYVHVSVGLSFYVPLRE